MEAPVVTVVDPLHPGRFAPAPEAPVRRPLRPVERVLATAVVLLLVAGLSSSARLRGQASAARALRALHVSVSAMDVRVRDSRVELLLLAGATRGIRLSDVRGSGWSLPATTPVPAHDLSGLTLSHPLDCTTPLEVPRDLTATADDGRLRGRVSLEVRSVLPLAERALHAACGDVDADEALVLVGSSITRGPRETTVGLRLSNLGDQDLRVLRVRYPGFALVSGTDLPLTLPARGAQVRDAELRVVLQDCGRARSALDLSKSSFLVDLLEVDVDGRGGPGTARLDVRGVLAYLEAAWQEGCD